MPGGNALRQFELTTKERSRGTMLRSGNVRNLRIYGFTTSRIYEFTKFTEFVDFRNFIVFEFDKIRRLKTMISKHHLDKDLCIVSVLPDPFPLPPSSSTENGSLPVTPATHTNTSSNTPSIIPQLVVSLLFDQISKPKFRCEQKTFCPN